MRKKFSLFSILFVFVFLIGLVGCSPAATPATSEPDTPAGEPAEPMEDTQEPAAPAEPAEAQDFITWFQYDQENVDPASDERTGNEYLRNKIPQFNEEFAGKWVWNSVHKSFDKISGELVAAHISGGDVPDLAEMEGNVLMTYYRNGVLSDLTEWAQQQSWYEDIDPSAKNACTTPDGALRCIPLAERPHLTYVWADRYPNGYPTTPEQFMVEAERLKAEGLSALTFFGSTAYGGDGATRAVWAIIRSFGGTYYDDEGNMLLNSPETVAAVEFLREIVANGYVAEASFAGSFLEEDAFKDASAGAIPTALFGYRYINPLTAPDGTKYDTGTSEDMINAITAGDVVMRPCFAPEGNTPGCNIDVQAVAIPVGSKNVEAAHDFINWLMTPNENAEFAVGPGGGFPALKSVQDHPTFQTPFYEQAKIALDASVCTPWQGTLERPNEAQEIIMNAIYKLIKEDPTLDIYTELTAAQEEYNANN
ncbi:MAG: extracellular solute-binding protein [Anaerolineaceae bacterium]|jgi:multiple sugar transport system substrate-binding protein|nr:extracellular solute-binding protein [Anaerolineaceae bacterium]